MGRALDKLEEILANNSEEAKEWNRIKDKARKYTREQSEFDNRFIRFRTGNIHTLFKLPRNCIDILLFLRGSINRDDGYNEEKGQLIHKKVWANLDKYYNNGLLVTARSQNYIAKEIGIDQAQVCRSIKTLMEKGYIKSLGFEIVYNKENQKSYEVTVFCLGVIIEGKEIYYHELDEEKPIKIDQEED